MTIVVRDATVGPLSGTRDVSCGATSTASLGTPSASATSCGRTVFAPWPISVDDVSTRIRPSVVSSIPAALASRVSPPPVNPAPCQPSARPIPDATWPGPASRSVALRSRTCSNSEAATARSRTSSAPTLSRSSCPVAVTSPTRYAQRRRSSAGDTPSASAIRLTCVSAANSVCGAPKPRIAPLGRVFVAIARDRIRTFGQAYGPPAWIVPRERTTADSVQ